MGEQLTSMLDTLGLILLAVGAGWLIGAATRPGWGCIAAGVVVLAGSFGATALRPRGGDRR